MPVRLPNPFYEQIFAKALPDLDRVIIRILINLALSSVIVSGFFKKKRAVETQRMNQARGGNTYSITGALFTLLKKFSS